MARLLTFNKSNYNKGCEVNAKLTTGWQRMTKVDQKVVLKIDWGPAVHFAGEVSLSWQRIVFYTYIFYTYGWKLYFRNFLYVQGIDGFQLQQMHFVQDQAGSSQSSQSRIKSSLHSPNLGKNQTELENAKKGKAIWFHNQFGWNLIL